jgi:hypothetical protein
MAVVAAFGVALVAAYESAGFAASHMGIAPAIPVALLTFIVVGAVALVGAARLDADVLSR